MLLFPYFWLAGAMVAAFCIWLDAGEVLLLHWAAVFLYLLSFLRWQRNGRNAALRRETSEEVSALLEMDQGESGEVLPAQGADDPRFGGRGPDDLKCGLMQQCVRREGRVSGLQVKGLSS